MGKRNFSSPLNSSASVIGGIGAKPRLRASRMSFSGRKKDVDVTQQFVDQAPKVQATNTANITTALTETNRILVEIQKQLSLDFANRIAEKKRALSLSRGSVRKQKLVKKENFVERGKQLATGVLAPFKKVVAPAKSIFDKLIEFVTIVGGGILLNNAWDWLSKKENRDKVKKVFDFISDNFSTIIGIIVGVKLIGVVRKILGTVKLIKKIVDFLRSPRGPRGRGPGGTGGKGGTPPPGGCPPPNCFDGPVTDIIREKFRERSFIDDILVPAIIGAGFVRGKPKPIETPKPVEEPIRVPVLPDGTPAPFAPEEQVFDAPGDDLFQYQPPQFLKWLSELPGANFFSPVDETGKYKPDYNPELIATLTSIAGLGGAASISFGPMLMPMLTPVVRQIVSKILNPRFLQPGVAQTGTTGATSGATATAGRTISKQTASTALQRISQIKFELKSKPFDEIVRIARGRGSQGMDSEYRRVAQNLLEQVAKGKGSYGKDNSGYRKIAEDVLRDLVSIGQRLSRGGTIRASNGMTVPGKGSGSVDSVPAMLAPGEEVVRASSANLFRPLLKDINDNAGRMWTALSNAITTQTKNNQIQEETNTKFTNLIEDFNKQLEDLIQKQRMPKSLREKLEEISGGSGSVLMGGPKQPTTSQTLKVTATPKSAPKSIQTYRRSGKSSGSGQPTIVNMPMPAMNLAGNQAPEAPNTNVHEPSTAPISISSFDSNNPYIAESLADYGIFI